MVTETALVVARTLEAGCLLVVVLWVSRLGGLSWGPTKLPAGGNDTGRLFNVHPVVMITAFGVVMAEALQAWRRPLLTSLDRPQRKILHAALQTLAILLIWIGATFAYLSHTLKQPTTIPNFYSTHSWLGILTISLATAQYLVGLSFLTQRVSAERRKQLVPVHAWFGRATFLLGIGTAMVGIQEKTTFVQVFGKAAVRADVLWLPAFLQLLLVCLAGAVLFVQTAPPEKDTPAGFAPLLDDDSREVL